MAMNPANLPAITIDLKKQRIRIHNNTLHLLGDPNYIDLLINPSLKILAIRESIGEYPFSHKIIYGAQQDHELYSKVLLERLSILHADIKFNNSYRLYGVFLPDKGLILFEMSNMLQIGEYVEEDKKNER